MSVIVECYPRGKDLLGHPGAKRWPELLMYGNWYSIHSINSFRDCRKQAMKIRGWLEYFISTQCVAVPSVAVQCVAVPRVVVQCVAVPGVVVQCVAVQCVAVPRVAVQ